MRGKEFHRRARAYPPRLPEDEIVIKAPPVLPPTQQGVASWLQCLFPFIGGLVASLGSVLYLIFYHSGPPLILIVIALGIPLVSVVMGLATNLVQRYLARKQRKAERARYLEHLDKCRARLQDAAQKQQEVSTFLFPELAKLAPGILPHERLWERRPEDQDFLHVRVGLGPAPLCYRVQLDLSTDPMVRYVPELLSRAEELVAQYQRLKDEPTVVPLRNLAVVAITGSPQATRAVVRAMLSQIAAFHAPEDVRFVALFPPNSGQDWSWLKWLPHARRLLLDKIEKHHSPEPLCLLADTIDDCQNLLKTQVMPELERRRKLSEDKKDIAANFMLPHLLFVMDSFAPEGALAQLTGIDEIFHNAAKLGITVICLVENSSQEPSAIQARITISQAGKLSIKEMKFGGSLVEDIIPDQAPIQTCEQLARNQAPLKLAGKGAQQDLSQDVRLLELLKFTSADAIQVAKTWQPREKQELLRAPIGRQANGEPLLLNVKEAADEGMGPHGLVVGATGSGKSELLRTLVTSLAVTHDPQTLNFVLVDFKGGASFADFVALPHVAGIITNLQSDLTLVDRFYASLLGEQERRQRMLRDAGNLSKIQEYQARWRARSTMGNTREIALEPMPYLLLIVDEFAELIAARSEFLDLFTKIGRVGRSLGMYMLLATQRIDEGRIKGLEGHLRYRICLRTFSAAESTSVLGNPNAYYLPSAPGVGYFKFDTTIPEMFKTALISTPYVPAAEQSSPAGLIRQFSSTGKLISYAASAGATIVLPTQANDEGATEMGRVIERLAEAQSVRNQARVHQVWLPPLGKALSLGEVLEKCGRSELDGSRWHNEPAFGALRIPIGLLDMPMEQAQVPFFLDFSSTGGHLVFVGAPQSGKSTLLRTIVASFITTHSPRDVQLYCVDLGGGLLRVFETEPHVGDVCSSSKEGEKIRRLIHRVRTIIDERELLFRQQGIDDMVAYRVRRQAGELADAPYGDVFLIIDNLAQLLKDFEQLEAEITDIVAKGLTFGVHVILATNRWAEVRPKLRENIGTRLELRLNDPTDSEFGKAAASALPPGVAGRGLNKDRLQFQTALPQVESRKVRDAQAEHVSAQQIMEGSVRQSLEALVQRSRAAWAGTPAPSIPLLPARVIWTELREKEEAMARAGSVQQPGVPLGLEEMLLDPIYVDLITSGPHFVVYGDSKCGKTMLLRTWMRGLAQRYGSEEVQFAIIDYRKTLLDVAEREDPHLSFYAFTPPLVTTYVSQLKGELEKRLLSSSQASFRELRNAPKWVGPHYFLFVDDYETILTSSGNPLNPLSDLLLHSRDIGFHLVVARSVGGSSRSYDQLLQRVKEMGSPGLIMSGDFQEGPLLATQRATILPPGRGYLVRRNQSTLIQVVLSEPENAQIVG